jgi:hypothetical protein
MPNDRWQVYSIEIPCGMEVFSLETVTSISREQFYETLADLYDINEEKTIH